MGERPSLGTSPDSIVRFGAFEANLHTGELRKGGTAIKIQGQPMLALTQHSCHQVQSS